MQDSHDPRALEVRHLRLVRAVAREASVTRAAALLHLSQSAVSHQLVDLERDLGTRLFDRVGKKMVLTSAGARMVEASERLLRELGTLERELLLHHRDARTPLRVTTSCYTSYHWLPAALELFSSKHPRVDLSIVLETTRRAVDALLDDEVDVAVVNDRPRDESLACVEITESELVVVGRKDHEVIARGSKGAVRFSDLRHATVLVNDGPNDQSVAKLEEAVRVSWEKKSGERLAVPIVVRKLPLTEAIIALARGGHGVAVLDRWIAEGYLDRSILALPLHPRTTRRFFAIYRKQNPRALPIDALVRVIGSHAAQTTISRRRSPGRARSPARPSSG